VTGHLWIHDDGSFYAGDYRQNRVPPRLQILGQMWLQNTGANKLPFFTLSTDTLGPNWATVNFFANPALLA
jgi:hypothetical protein